MLTVDRIVLAIVAAIGWFVILRWAWKWEIPIPAVMACQVIAVERKKNLYTLRLRVESVSLADPDSFWARVLRSWVKRAAPRPGQERTFQVPRRKWRFDLRAGDRVVLEGRVLHPVRGGEDVLSIHRHIEDL